MMRRAAPLVLLVALAGCEGAPSWVPRLTIPQFEQARESVRGGVGRRYEDYGACNKSATDAKTMVACMDVAGYAFVPRSGDLQATECWRIRDLNPRDTVPDVFCFLRKTQPEP